MTSRIPGKQTGLSPDGWIKVSSSVAASTTVDVDSVPLADFQMIQYIVTAFNTTSGVRKMFQMSVTKKTSSLNTVVYGKIGESIAMGVNLNISGPDAKVEVVNSELFTLQLRLARIIFI